MFQGLFGAQYQPLAPVEGVVHEEVTLTGVDGNDVTPFIHRPGG